MLVTDIETNGLLDNPDLDFHCGWIWDSKTNEYSGYRPDDFEAYLDKLLDAIDDNELIVFHNGICFDIPALKKIALSKGLEFPVPKESVIDTLVLSRLIYSNIKESDLGRFKSGKLPGKLIGSHSLESWGYRLGEMKGEYKDDFKEALELQGEQYEPGMEWLYFNEDMYAYCHQDVVVTVKLLEKLLTHKWYNRNPEWQQIHTVQFWEEHPYCFTLEHTVAWLMQKQEENGFPFDHTSMVKVYEELSFRRDQIKEELQTTFGSWYKPKGGKEYFKLANGQLDMDSPKVTYPKRNRKGKNKEQYLAGCPYTPVELITFNPSSREHIGIKLQEAGWKPNEFTESGQPMINDEVLKDIKVKDPHKQKCVDLIAEYLMVQKRIGQIAEGPNAWLNLEEHGYLHGHVNPNGAVTGRATHAFPNMAQVPSVVIDRDTKKFVYGLPGGYGTECREAFGACHHDGWIQAGIDARGLELRCLGHFMAPYDNGEYIDTILNGDIHTKNQEAAGLPTRDNAKTFIYGFLYGAGDAKIGEIVGGSAEEGKKLKTKFLSNTPAIKDLREVIQHTLVESSTWNNGINKVVWKRRFLKGLDGRAVHVRSPHAALNTLLQSAGALICKEWIVETEAMLTTMGYKHGWDGDFVYLAWVHDEIQIGCRTKEIAETVVEVAQRAMRNTQKKFNFKCQLDTEGKIGRNWAECH